MSRTAASEQPSDNFAGLFVDFLVDEGNSSPVINYHSVHCLDFLSHNSVFIIRTTGQIYIPSPNQKTFVSQAVSQNPNMYKPH